MRVTQRTAAATALVMSIVILYAGYVAGGIPFLRDPEGMAGAVLILGIPAAFLGGWIAHPWHGFARFASAGATFVAAGLGITALVTMDVLDTATREAIVALCVAIIFALYIAHTAPSLYTGRPNTE